jgi:hypothetical protein
MRASLADRSPAPDAAFTLLTLLHQSTTDAADYGVRANVAVRYVEPLATLSFRP